MTHVPALPAARVARLLLDVLIRHGRVPGDSGWRAEIAPGGSTDRTFSVIDPRGEPRLTVRLARPGLADRLRHEQRLLRELARDSDFASVRPTPVDVHLIEDDALPERWLLVHEHLAGHPAPVAEVPALARERLGACLAWVHGHPRDTYTIWPSLAGVRGTRADLYRARFDTLRRYRATRLLPDAAGLLDRLLATDLPASAGWQERDFAICHGDLSIGNILWNGDAVALIDWEFARDGDPAEDIAYITAEQNLSPGLIAEIAEAYVAADGDPWAFARLPVWLPLVALDAALWWADYHLAQGGDPAGQRDVAARLALARAYLGA